MLQKPFILLVILALLLVFYLVISLGASKNEQKEQSSKIKNYLFGVRTLIFILAIVGVILWFFL